jgi:hypothetical protein
VPSTDEILIGLSAVANEQRSVAIAWHVVFAVSLLAALAGWRPSTRATAYLLASPFMSVAAAAFASGNPFNGMVFLALFLALVTIASRLSREPARFGLSGLVIPGALLVAFGWVYPHFLETDRWTTYAYAAPLGLLPCPTISAAIGSSLVLGHFGSRPWAFTLAAAGLVYGAIGAFTLGVKLDYVLLAGSLVTVASVGTSTALPADQHRDATAKRRRSAA